jgi:hypothetical protein
MVDVGGHDAEPGRCRQHLIHRLLAVEQDHGRPLTGGQLGRALLQGQLTGFCLGVFHAEWPPSLQAPILATNLFCLTCACRGRGFRCRRFGGRVGRLGAMLFATHVDITTLGQNEQCQARKNDKTHSNFPHTVSPEKKDPRKEGLSNTPAHAVRVNQNTQLSRWRRCQRPSSP